MICPKCDGTGIEKIEVYDIETLSTLCDFCRGKGDINWIENVFGVQRKGLTIWGQKTLMPRKNSNEGN